MHKLGLRVVLLERHLLPLVAMHMVVPAGAADDPPGKEGLAYATANMLDEGAGPRSAIALSDAIDRLGATVSTGASHDASWVALTTLKSHLDEAVAIFGDVVARPQLAATEWKRVHDLWINGLQARASNPQAVAGVVASRELFGASPYGHPVEGLVASAGRIRLPDVAAFYNQMWRRDRATLVVVGDVSRTDLDALVDTTFASWRPSGAAEAATQPSSTKADVAVGPSSGTGTVPRIVLVDRPEAPQSVVLVARRAVAANHPELPALLRVNEALGGSFSSRLNQDLREEHGWTYGARSAFSTMKNAGVFKAAAAIQTEHTAEALQAMLADVQTLASNGLTSEELEKTRLLLRSTNVQTFERIESAAQSLADNAGLGLAPDHDAVLSAAVDRATADQMHQAARAHLRTDDVVVVIVGPRGEVKKQLHGAGFSRVTEVTAEGQPR